MDSKVGGSVEGEGGERGHGGRYEMLDDGRNLRLLMTVVRRPGAGEGGKRGRWTEGVGGVELGEDEAQGAVRDMIQIGERERGDSSSSTASVLLSFASTERSSDPKLGLLRRTGPVSDPVDPQRLPQRRSTANSAMPSATDGRGGEDGVDPQRSVGGSRVRERSIVGLESEG